MYSHPQIWTLSSLESIPNQKPNMYCVKSKTNTPGLRTVKSSEIPVQLQNLTVLGIVHRPYTGNRTGKKKTHFYFLQIISYALHDNVMALPWGSPPIEQVEATPSHLEPLSKCGSCAFFPPKAPWWKLCFYI